MSLLPAVLLCFVVAGVLLYLATIYNGLVSLRNDIDKSWANIDVLLKQRHDEVPRLVDVCKGYMQYERETLQSLVEARSRYTAANTVAEKARASQNLSASMGNVLAVAEKYPALQASTSFLELQKRITELESQIADRREFYNDAINAFNTRIQAMPDTLMARLFGMTPRPMFQATPAEKTAPQVTLSPRGA
jgi:LemA protein